jgi:hypothetical protein
VLVFTLNGAALIWAVIQPERWTTSLVMVLIALCLAVLEGVQVVQSSRSRPVNTTIDTTGRRR